MATNPLSAREIRAVTSAGVSGIVLMLIVWFVSPRIDALVFTAGVPIPAPIRWFRTLYALWPFILLAAAAITALVTRLPADDPRRRGLILLEWALAALSIVIIMLGVISVYLPIFMLPGMV